MSYNSGPQAAMSNRRPIDRTPIGRASIMVYELAQGKCEVAIQLPAGVPWQEFRQFVLNELSREMTYMSERSG